MNSSHYPSLELCKKLTEIGFPKNTDAVFHKNLDDNPRHWDSSTMQRIHYYVCPSVMEMLDVIPEEVNDWSLAMNWRGWGYQNDNDSFEVDFSGTTPNALAETVLWLHAEGHIKF